jgi:ubiquinone/menaquinone biosynthesis C-methylase UbiE
MNTDKLRKSLAASLLGFEKEPMDSFYSHPLLGFYSRYRVRTVLKELGDVKGKRVVDVGCEAGYVSFELMRRGAQTISFDPCVSPLLKFKEKIGTGRYKNFIGLFQALAHAMPLKDETADFIVCTEVIQLTPYLDIIFSEFHRILKPGGRLVLTFPMEPHKKKFYPIAERLGLEVEYQKELTPYHYTLRDVRRACRDKLKVVKAYNLPISLFPLTALLVCLKNKA